MQNRIQSKVSGISHFFLSVGIFVLSLIAMTGIAMIVVQQVYGMSLESLSQISITDATVSQTMAIKVAQLIIALSFIVAGFVCAKTFRQDFGTFTGLKHKFNIRQLVVSVLLFLCLIPVIDSLVRFNASWTFSESLTKTFVDLEAKSDHTYALFLKFNTGSQFFFNLLIISILAGVGEEIFFRGILMRVLAKWFGNIHVGIVLSAVLFTTVHFQPYKVLPMLTLGLFLGYVYYRTKSLWIPIIIHVLNNALVVIADYGEKVGDVLPVFSADFQFQPTIVIASTVFFIVVSILFWKFTKNHNFDYE